MADTKQKSELKNPVFGEKKNIKHRSFFAYFVPFSSFISLFKRFIWLRYIIIGTMKTPRERMLMTVKKVPKTGPKASAGL